MAVKLITGPTDEPVSLDEAKAHLRAESDDDALIASLIATARQSVETITGRALMPQTWELALDEFPRRLGRSCPDAHVEAIDLPKPPIISLQSVKYVDTNGALQTLAEAAYQLDDYSEPARLLPAYGTSWPAARRQPNAVLIRFQAGYADAASVPQQIKQWMLMRIGAMYENREEIIVGQRVVSVDLPFVDRLLDPYRVWGYA
jgi:uncharacterized phiE125 gp8 family phage protein